MGNGAEIDDLVQEVFVCFFRRLPTLQDPRAISGFVISITLNIARTEVRRQSVRRALCQGWGSPSWLDPDPEAREALAHFCRILEGLGPSDVTAFMLRFVDHRDLAEVASILGVSLSTAKRRLARAWQRVMAQLQRDPALSSYRPAFGTGADPRLGRRAECGKLRLAVAESPQVAVQYSLPTSLPEWELPEVPVPESPEHDEIADRLKHVLLAWLVRSGRGGTVRRNLALRWDERNPKVGVDPDVCWIDEPPPGFFDGDVDSLKLWSAGHRVPPLAIEIVSRNHPYKDYGRVQEKYAVVGVQELWVFDPRKFGPKALGGPVLLQVWTRSPAGVLIRRHFSDEPARSEMLGAWIIPQLADHLIIADDKAGRRPWCTPAEQERAHAEQERARADQEHARAEQERARADALEAELRRRS